MRAHLSILLFVVACGGGGGGGGGGTIDAPGPNADAKVYMDAPPAVPPMIAFMGTASERGLGGSTPVAGLAASVYARTNDATALGMATTDAQGKYSLSFPTGGMPVDGYMKAAKTGYIDVYMYPAFVFLKNEAMQDINMLTQSNFDFLNSLASGGQMASNGMIALAVVDAAGMPVAGATVSSTPASGAYRYNGSNGLPSGTATVTDADGYAYMFNVPPTADVTVTAAKSGIAFHAHVVKARAGKFTVTSVAP